MAVKGYRVIDAVQVNLYCDKCGKVMSIDKYLSIEYPMSMTKRYKCECGYTVVTDQSYPYQRLTLDMSHEVEDV